MSEAIQKLYESKEYCFKEIQQIRASLGDKSKLTQELFDAASKSLGFMYLYCPEEIKNLVWGQMNEVTIREKYFLLSYLK